LAQTLITQHEHDEALKLLASGLRQVTELLGTARLAYLQAAARQDEGHPALAKAEWRAFLDRTEASNAVPSAWRESAEAQEKAAEEAVKRVEAYRAVRDRIKERETELDEATGRPAQ
jgi:hypothetical protein